MEDIGGTWKEILGKTMRMLRKLQWEVTELEQRLSAKQDE